MHKKSFLSMMPTNVLIKSFVGFCSAQILALSDVCPLFQSFSGRYEFDKNGDKEFESVISEIYF